MKLLSKRSYFDVMEGEIVSAALLLDELDDNMEQIAGAINLREACSCPPANKKAQRALQKLCHRLLQCSPDPFSRSITGKFRTGFW